MHIVFICVQLWLEVLVGVIRRPPGADPTHQCPAGHGTGAAHHSKSILSARHFTCKQRLPDRRSAPMRNWLRSSGVYTNMLRVSLFLVCSLAAVGQPSPRQNPMDAAIQAVEQVRYGGRTEEIAALREQAHALLQRVPADSAQFANWAQQVAHLYQNPNRNANWNAAARAILQEALARTRPLGDSHPSRFAILDALGWSWRQDGNLLKAAGYLEEAAAAQPATPSAVYMYTSLASLYRQLGRPNAVAAIAVKIRALASNNQTALAQFYEQQGQLDEAAAIYRTLAEQPDPQARSNALQSLASVYARQEHYADAVAATQQVIAALQSSDNPGIRDQALWMRQNLARYMRQAGEVDQAEQVHQQFVQENRGGPQESPTMTMYAQFLSETKRAAQGESLLGKKWTSSSTSPTSPEARETLSAAISIRRRARRCSLRSLLPGGFSSAMSSRRSSKPSTSTAGMRPTLWRCMSSITPRKPPTGSKCSGSCHRWLSSWPPIKNRVKPNTSSSACSHWRGTGRRTTRSRSSP